MALVPPPRSPDFDGPDELDLRVREVALRLAIENRAPGDSIETFDRVVRYFECYLRTGKLGTDQ